MTLEIENSGQLLVSKQMGKSQVGEKIIPGETIMGALARAYIESTGLDAAHDSPGFRHLFLDGAVVFENGCPVNHEGELFYPAPVSIVKEKVGEYYYDTVRDEDRQAIREGNKETHRGFGGFVTIGENSIKTMDVAAEMEYHHRRPLDKSIGHAREQDGRQQGEFFQFSVIKPGHRFRSAISGEFKYIRRLLELLKDRPWFYLGKSATAQYGRCRVTVKEMSGVTEEIRSWQPGESVVLTLVSDMILANEYGCIVPDPVLLTGELAERWQIAGSAGLKIERQFLAFRRLGGFMGVWRMPKIQHTALAAGSVVVVRNDTGGILEWSHIGDPCFGLYTEHGCGRVRLDWHGQVEGEIRVRPDPGQPADVPLKDELLPLREFLQAILTERLKLLLKREAIGEADRAARRLGQLPSGSFLGKMAALIQAADAFDSLNDKLEKLRKPAKEQLEAVAGSLKITDNRLDRRAVGEWLNRHYLGLIKSPDLKANLVKSGALVEDFFQQESSLFDLYRVYAVFVLHQLKLKRRENE